MNFQHNFENDLQKKNTFTYEIQKVSKPTSKVIHLIIIWTKKT